MSLLLKTIEAFPLGRTTNELMVLLDVTFDGARREAVGRELAELQAKGVVSLGRDHRWRAQHRPLAPSSASAQRPIHSGNALSDLLIASPATFTTKPVATDVLPDEHSAASESELDPHALLRYYKSALLYDPRGALTQTGDRHGETFQLLAGEGNLFPASDEEVIVRIRADDLPGAFREAMIRRDDEENGVALGWPLDLGRKSGAPAIRPVGLLAAVWSRNGDFIELRVDADDVLVNPDWVQSTARITAWTQSDLQDLFRGNGGSGLPGEEFLGRLREAAARAIRGNLMGNSFAAMIDPGDTGIHNAVALFLSLGSTFTAGVVRDLDSIAAWPSDRLCRTALAPLIGLPNQAPVDPVPPINVGPLNMEQIEATAQAMRTPLSVVTGPPGTGKSQVIVAIATTALWAGQTVIVASKNHQALDAVEQRLSSIAPAASFIVRTLDPARDVDRDMAAVLRDLVSEPAGTSVAAPESDVAAELDKRANARLATLERIAKERRLRLQLAEDIERLQSRQLAGLPDTTVLVAEPSSSGFWRRLLSWLGFASSLATPDMDDGTIPAATFRERVAEARASLANFGPIENPVTSTQEIASLARQIFGRRVTALSTPDERTRLALSKAHDNLQLYGHIAVDRELAKSVLLHRPLWLASVLGAPRRLPLEDGLFDLAIFDEASQCDIGSALPVLARARRAVIVGDDRQLTFIPQLGIAQDRNLMAAQQLPQTGMGRFAQSRKSLFDLARSTPDVPAVMLRDQYRSAADIVAYINHDFYGGKLRVAADQDGLCVPTTTRPGLHWTHVPPAIGAETARGNVNSAETCAIVTHLEQLLLKHDYDGSVGVISPFRPQVAALAEAITTHIPENRRHAANLRVDTVDAFQGQERDLILFSPVLHDRIAPSAISFLQKDWRRLNVAISRARAIAHVFGDLYFARRGTVRRLQSLAARATEPRQPPDEGVFDSTWERRVYEALRARGLDPKPQYEIAGRRLDFAVFGAGGIRVDIEVDGRRWHQDIDGNRKLDDHWRDHQLHSLGWKVRRFWVDELDKDLESCLDLIERDLS